LHKQIKKLAALLLLGITLSITVVNTALAINVDEWLPSYDLENNDGSTTPELSSLTEKLAQYENLPKPELNDLFITAIRTILFLAGAMVTVGIIVSGIFFLTSAGNEEGQTKAKKILGYLGIGIIIISVSYAIVSGILEINLFN
jgi:hypothetical protein